MEEFIGIVRIFAGTFAPQGWVMCDGSSLSIAQYTTLYSIIGTTFGGDGVNTFNVPDLRGVVPVGAGVSLQGRQYVEGQAGGTETVTLTLANLPAHAHSLTGSVQVLANADASETSDPTGAFPGPTAAQQYATTGDAPMGAVKSTLGVSVQGAGSPMENRSPFTAINYVICAEGIFPPRN